MTKNCCGAHAVSDHKKSLNEACLAGFLPNRIHYNLLLPQLKTNNWGSNRKKTYLLPKFGKEKKSPPLTCDHLKCVSAARPGVCVNKL